MRYFAILLAILALSGTGCAMQGSPFALYDSSRVAEMQSASDAQLLESVNWHHHNAKTTTPSHVIAELVRRGIVRDEWANKVSRKVFNIGMTDAELVASIGRPESINRSVTAHSRVAQWVYPWVYVYLEGPSCLIHSPIHPRWPNDGPYKAGGCLIRSWQD